MKKLGELTSLHLAKKENVIIFNDHIEILDEIGEYLVSKLKVSKALVHNFNSKELSSATRRQSQLEAFRDAGGVLLATQIGAKGLNIESANVVILSAPAYNYAKTFQQIGRVRRPAQQKAIYVYQLLVPFQKKVYGILLKNYLKAKSLLFKRTFLPFIEVEQKLGSLDVNILFDTLLLEQQIISRNEKQNQQLMKFEPRP
jgi:superfamily II DNA or RNA helicase